MAKTLGKEAVLAAEVGRMGHGIGLHMIEPPSIHPEDETVLEPGMVITLEPGIGYTAEDGEKKVMVHEENIAITERGAVLLSRRAPAAMPANGQARFVAELLRVTEIDVASLNKGTRQSFAIAVVDLADDSSLHVPVHVAVGHKAGSCLAVVAGVTGMRLRASLPPIVYGARKPSRSSVAR